MHVIELIRNIVVAVAATITLFHYGPHIVDQYYLPTIEYVADTFLAVAPQPPPATTFARVQPAMAVPHTTMMTKTIFVKEGAFMARSTPQGAMITGVEHQSESSSHQNGFFNRFSSAFEWTREVTRAILLHLRGLLLNLSHQVKLLTGAAIAWQLIKLQSQNDLEYLSGLHETELAQIEEQTSELAVAQNLEIASLKAQIESQKLQLAEKETLLNEARGNLTSAEEQSKSELAKLNSSLTDKDNMIAERDGNLAEANERVKTAEDSKKILEKKAKKDRSDYDSAIQKKENEVAIYKRSSEQATEDKDSARTVLKETRAQARQDRNRIADLDRQVTESTQKISELEAQSKDVKRIMTEKDKALKEGELAKTTEKKRFDALQAQLTKANKLRDAAEKKISTQETLAAEATKILQSKEEKISSLKEESRISCAYLQRNLDAVRATNSELLNTLDKERAEAQQATAKSRQTEESLQERIARLEEQIRSTPSSSNTAASSSHTSTLEPSPSPRPHPIVRFPGRPGPASSANGNNTAPSEDRRLPANTPTGPKSGRPRPRCVPPPNGTTKTRPEERGLPADTPTGPKGGRGGRKS